ncbi:hypothetical protein [Prevotella sp.]|jgi:hypothetical protein|uniref:hypothetical protein n=1 Tax=Prevotella sp. TaxID=59823 RepID=UPI003DA35A16
MKLFIKKLTMASVMLPILGSCTGLLGTQEWKIKKVATAYVEQGLKDDEHMRWGSIIRKLHREVNGKACTYAEVKYTIVSDNGNTYKTLYLLLSENCDSVYSASNKKL